MSLDDIVELEQDGNSIDGFPPSSSVEDTIQVEEEIKFRVPSCPELDHANIARILSPYENLIDQVQAILLWRRFSVSAICVGIIELCFRFGKIYQIQFCNGLVLLIAACSLCHFIYRSHREFFLTVVFPPIVDRGGQDESNRIYSLDEVARFISIFGSRIHCFWLGCVQKASDRSVAGRLVWVMFLVCMFTLFTIVPTYLIGYVGVHAVLVLPVVLHPKIYPLVLPQLQQLLRLIAPKISAQNQQPE
jgi:hypothetical protein